MSEVLYEISYLGAAGKVAEVPEEIINQGNEVICQWLIKHDQINLRDIFIDVEIQEITS